jgi:hypothetical protein
MELEGSSFDGTYRNMIPLIDDQALTALPTVPPICEFVFVNLKNPLITLLDRYTKIMEASMSQPRPQIGILPGHYYIGNWFGAAHAMRSELPFQPCQLDGI